MKKATFFILTLLTLLSVQPVMAMYQLKNVKTIKVATEESTVVTTNTRLKNAGENTRIMVKNEVQEHKTATQSSRSLNSREHMSVVAKKVESVLNSQTSKGKIGEQIRVVAINQQQSQLKIQEHLDKLEARTGWLKKLLGPNYQELNSLKEQLETNQQRIEELQTLQTQLDNPDDSIEIENLIQVLTEQNEQLTEKVKTEEQAKSILGWLMRLF